METLFEVSGMTCGGCARRVRDAVRRIPHVAEVEVLLGERRVRVAHGPEVVPETIADAIKAAGYVVEARCDS